jgi:protein tyrosine phosphatase (PTP) superfamily phosphohydrolase (DUF442 family)
VRLRLSRIFWGTLVVIVAVAVGAAGYYGYLRYVMHNFHPVVPGKVYRSAQPDADGLRDWITRYGLRTIVNLRADAAKHGLAEETAVARQAGVAVINIRLPNGSLPESPLLMHLADVLESAEKPMLIHCRQGADRTGVASVMARMAVGGKTYDRSREQLDIRFLHLAGDAGQIGGVLEKYEQYCRQRGTGTGGWREFRDWVFSVYQPSYAYVRIDVPGHLAAGPGQAVAVAARIVNLSTRAIPAGAGQKQFALVAFSGAPFRGEVDREFSAHVPLPKADIPPGGRAAVDITLTAPRQPGHYLVHFDVLEDGAAYFSESGSPLPDCDLEVAEAVRGNCGLRIVDCGFTAKEAWPAAGSLSFNPQFAIHNPQLPGGPPLASRAARTPYFFSRESASLRGGSCARIPGSLHRRSWRMVPA